MTLNVSSCTVRLSSVSGLRDCIFVTEGADVVNLPSSFCLRFESVPLLSSALSSCHLY
jgi:hypothetical protein